MKQRGMVLFFALIALVVMSLAAVALIRSVDTSTLIAGNLAFRQAATSSGDAGINAALVWLATEQAAMDAAGKDVYVDSGCPAACAHTFNITDPARGYYSNADPATILTNSAVWNAVDQTILPEITEAETGNKIRYIIQRMCRDADVAPLTTNCLYSSVTGDTGEQKVKKVDEECPTGCTTGSAAPQIRITSRVIGPRDTVSYIQSFVY